MNARPRSGRSLLGVGTLALLGAFTFLAPLAARPSRADAARTTTTTAATTTTTAPATTTAPTTSTTTPTTAALDASANQTSANPASAAANQTSASGNQTSGNQTSATGAAGGSSVTVQPIDPVVVASVPTVSNGAVKVTVTSPKGTNNPVLIVVLVTLASFLPGLLMVATTFPRFLIVLGLTRQALGLNTTPPNQVLTGLAAFLTLFAMSPVFSKMNEVALQPALKGTKTQAQAMKDGWQPLRDFLLDHTRAKDLDLFESIAKEKPATPKDVSPRVLIPAYIISELRAAFTIGFLIWVPFLLIDLIVSSVLSAMGMLMMPPVVISLPVKLVLFVLVDGWALLVGSLLKSVT